MIGVSIQEFYKLTILDIECIMEAENKKIEYERRKNYENCLVLTALVGGMFNGENVSYDTLFNSDSVVDESWKLQRDQFLSFAENYNKGVSE